MDPKRDNNAQRERTTVLLRPPTLECVAQADEDVLVSWSPVPGATSYNVYRSEAAGPFLLLATTTETSYEDTTTVPETAYTYVVTAFHDGIESERSEPCTVTAIPFFPGAIGLALAVLGAVAVCIAIVRKRRG